MKPNELMVGDWVLFATRPTKINGIALGGFSIQLEHEGWQPISAIEPIPLTAEILEKNGFKFGYTASEEEFCNAVGCGYPEKKGWCYDEGAGEIKIIFPNETDGGLIRLDDQCADKHLELVFVKPIMVHKLQHALHLCGIDYEIKL